MPYSISGIDVSFTGTETSPSGFGGVAGVVTDTSGDSTTWRARTLNLLVYGTLSIMPGQGCFDIRMLRVMPGGRIIAGQQTLVNGEYVYSSGLWLKVANKGDVAWSPGGLIVESGGFLDWYGGEIDVASSPYLNSSGVNIKRGVMHLRPTLVQVARCLCAGSTQVSNLTLYNNGFGPEGSFTGSFSNCKVVDGAVIGMHGAVINLTITDFDYEARGSILTTAANSKWVSKNTVRGMAAQNGHNVQPARLLFTKDLSFTVRNPSGAAIPNVSIYTKEYIGTNRPVAGFIPGDDFTAPITSVVSTNASGVATFLNWRLGLTYRNAGNYYQSFWTKSGNNTDNQDFALWGYGVLPQSLDVSLKGAGTRTTETALLPDINATLSESSAVAKLAAAFVVNSGSNTITVTAASTLDNLYDALKVWKTRPIAAQLEYPTISTQPVVASGDTLVTSMTITGIEFLTAGSKFKKIQAANHVAGGAIANLSIVGNVTQATPTNLSAVSITGALAYNTASPATISLTNSQIGTVRNDGAGVITITRDAASSITNYTDAEINFLDSSIIATNITSATIYQTAANRDTNTNAGATFTSSQPFKLGSVLNGVTMSGTVYLRVVVGSVTLLAEINLALGDNVLDLGTQGQLSAISAKIDTRPTLAQIEASSVLARESTLSTGITQLKANQVVLHNGNKNNAALVPPPLTGNLPHI